MRVGMLMYMRVRLFAHMCANVRTYALTCYNMYKWIYGWKDPENYPEGTGYQLQEFKYKNDWSDGWSMKKKLAKTAQLLGTNNGSCLIAWLSAHKAYMQKKDVFTPIFLKGRFGPG